MFAEPYERGGYDLVVNYDQPPRPPPPPLELEFIAVVEVVVVFELPGVVGLVMLVLLRIFVSTGGAEPGVG